MWALHMLESSGQLPFLQAIIISDNDEESKICNVISQSPFQQEGMLSTMFPMPINLCFLITEYLPQGVECPQVGFVNLSLYDSSHHLGMLSFTF